VLFEDETDIVLFPPLRATWARRGQSSNVHISGGNARRVVSGILNVHTGHRLWMVQARQRAVEFRTFLECIHRHYRGRPIALFLDEDSSHTAHASTDYAAILGIQLKWLPVRCPELNPLENLWRVGKGWICANRQYASIDQQAQLFIEKMQSMSSIQALASSGVISGNFWLF
jgi:hypothetical protein